MKNTSYVRGLVVAGSVAVSCLTACNGQTDSSGVGGAQSSNDSGDQSFDDIIGEYRWLGTRISFDPAKTRIYGDFSGLVANNVETDLVARLFVEEGKLFLSAPFCTKIPLVRNGSVLTAEKVECPITDVEWQNLVAKRTIRGLKIDLQSHSMHSYRDVVGAISGVTTSDDSFVRFSGQRGADGALPPRAGDKTYVDAVEGYYFIGSGVQWSCESVVDGVCADVGLQDQRQMPTGNVYRFSDGRFYMQGYDCWAEQGYDGPPLQCGKSMAEYPRGDIPEVWMTRFSLEADHLRFDAELRLGGKKLFTIIDTPVEKF